MTLLALWSPPTASTADYSATGFRTREDICNRALQHCGVPMLDPTLGLEDGSAAALHTGFVYDKLRRAELRRNHWVFAVRHALLRPLTATSRKLDPALFVSGTTYQVGSLVKDSFGAIWISNSPSHSGNVPGAADQWELYYGPLAADAYDETVAYSAGEVVYVADDVGGYSVYLSLADDNEEDPEEAADYVATTVYGKGALVDVSGTVYVSLVDLNKGNAPASSPSQWSTTTGTRGTGSSLWQAVSVSLVQIFGAFPSSSNPSSHRFMLPANFLRVSIQDPTAGLMPALGGPTGNLPRDWVHERGVIRSASPTILLRFIGDVVDVKTFDAMFCEGLATRIGFEVCEPLTQSGTKKQGIAAEYARFMTEARAVNAIEIGPVEDVESELITCRM